MVETGEWRWLISEFHKPGLQIFHGSSLPNDDVPDFDDSEPIPSSLGPGETLPPLGLPSLLTAK